MLTSHKTAETPCALHFSKHAFF